MGQTIGRVSDKHVVGTCLGLSTGSKCQRKPNNFMRARNRLRSVLNDNKSRRDPHTNAQGICCVSSMHLLYKLKRCIHSALGCVLKSIDKAKVGTSAIAVDKFKISAVRSNDVCSFPVKGVLSSAKLLWIKRVQYFC